MRLFKRPGSPYWWYDFTAKGERYRGSSKKTSEREARIVAAELLTTAERAVTRRDGWTISHALGTWWDEHASTTRSADAIWSNIENLNRCLDCAVKLTDLTNAMLLDFRAKRRGEGVQPPTINRDMAYLFAAINHVQSMHGQQVAPIAWKKLKYPENEWRIRFLSADEYQRLLAVADPDLAAIIRCAVSTGLRKAKIAEMQWHQVDLSGRTITVPTGKGRKPHIARISTSLLAELEAIRQRQAKEANAIPVGHVFNTTNFRRRWHRAKMQAELTDFRFHDLRHTFGTWARKGGADLIGIKEAMNHSSIAMTMRYAHIDPDHEITAFDRTAAIETKAARHNPRHTKENKA